jgi:GNAT superfamily N-acetyltransferase
MYDNRVSQPVASLTLQLEPSVSYIGTKMLGAANIGRFLRGLSRPSKANNTRLLRARGESATSLVIRDATPLDIPALARLHVTTWNAAHGWRPNGPTYELRERQWRDTFDQVDGVWFCFVVERPNGELVGFAKGVLYDGDLPGFGGELNKIYLLREYQRHGLGRRLVGYVARRFLDRGITSMVLFGEATNPACRFWDVLSGERLYTANSEFHGGYGWRDLRSLASLCLVE